MCSGGQGISEVERFGSDTIFLSQLKTGLGTYLLCFVQYRRGYHCFQYRYIKFFVAHGGVGIIQILVCQVGDICKHLLVHIGPVDYIAHGLLGCFKRYVVQQVAIICPRLLRYFRMVDIVGVGKVYIVPIMLGQKVGPLFRCCHHLRDGGHLNSLNGILRCFAFVLT